MFGSGQDAYRGEFTTNSAGTSTNPIGQNTLAINYADGFSTE